MKIIKTILATALLATTTPTLVYANSLKEQLQQAEQGITAYEQGDYHTAFELLKPLAERGDAGTQTFLGTMYYDGQGVQQDYQQAAKWFQKAAEQGYAKAQYNLGVMYYKGQGVQQDYQRAVKWYQKAAEQGSAEAQGMLGVLYGLGQGVQKDSAKAKMWFGKACDNGLQIACDTYRKLYKGQ
ncbi:YbeQ [Canicola haemoglobinophilus]|uniref:YbeQ n=1 Tax=Canicola haemoglobinophilus TaxID=733 RepID=A0AB38H5U0_9PAST|nr:tetratricopeptide repeat protein [Canicola haemoglobinophilus]STO54628.1 YbeQ [Canicola haemoglobinophilus]STO67597.1 YbeQ [Canicola haemoglobinophilus]